MIIWNAQVPSRSGRPILMDVFAQESAVPRGALLFLHGGGFTKGKKEQFLGICAALALKTDFLCATLAYHLASSEVAFPTQIVDVYDTVRFLTAQSVAWKIDPQKIVLSGGSPGGCIAAVSMLLPPEAPAYSADMDARLRSGILLNGIVDIPRFARMNPGEEEKLLCFMPSQEIWEDYSPLRLAPRRGRGKRFLLLHGAKDRIVPPEDALAFADAVCKASGRAEAVFLPGEGHAWFNEPSKQPSVIERIADFLTDL